MKVFDVLQQFNARMDAARRERHEKEKALKERVGAREERINTSKKELKKIDKQHEKNMEIYRDLLEEEAAEFARLKSDVEKLKADHQKGKIDLNAFLAQNKKDGELEAIAHKKFVDKIESARIACADVARERLRIAAAIEEENSWIGVEVKEFWRKFVELLDREKQYFEKYLSFGYGVPGNSREDYGIAKGGVTSIKNWEPKSWDELKMIVISGLVQQKHFKEFDEMITNLRGAGLDFERQKLVVKYRAGRMAGFPEGFEYNAFDKIRPGIVTIPTGKGI